ncbi:class I SAM-dependent methyltransferase [Nocardia sp. NPDC050712]|uniref:class I SAM-dependent methyltransferase n=1 Tax=Nocardia sp. NPDC050712 TaxID=3155518 RepID=UPI0034089C29
MRAEPVHGHYVFDNGNEKAGEQFQLLCDILNAHTVGVLRATGVTSGWHCWDIGAGNGTIAHWLARAVGPTGTVLATDLAPQHVPPHDSLEIRSHDVRGDDLPGTFDLIHVRLVLMHLPEREAVLRRLLAALAPGGVLVVSDWDGPQRDFVITAPDAEAAAAVGRFGGAMHTVAGLAGIDFSWARRAPAVFHQAGLADVRCTGVGEIWPGGSPGCALFRLHTLLLPGPLTAAGLAPGDLDTLADAFTRPDLRLWSLRIYTTTGRLAA